MKLVRYLLLPSAKHPYISPNHHTHHTSCICSFVICTSSEKGLEGKCNGWPASMCGAIFYSFFFPSSAQHFLIIHNFSFLPCSNITQSNCCWTRLPIPKQQGNRVRPTQVEGGTAQPLKLVSTHQLGH
jgi:hypothetical protein